MMRMLHVLAIVGGTALVATSGPAFQGSGSISVGPAREQTSDEQVKHVLNRLAFGARPGDIERVRELGVDRWIAQQLEPSRIADSHTERFLARFGTLTLSVDELAQQFPPPQVVRAQMRREMGGGRDAMLSAADSAALKRAGQTSRRLMADLQTAKVARAIVTERQLEEVMVDFWQNHFSVFAGKGPERYFLGSYERDVIRQHALGNFRAMLGAVAKSPAMLYYLDNWQSSVEPNRQALSTGSNATSRGSANRRAQQRRRPTRGLNENYARELLELHTLGVDGGYTQSDVIDVARALTGWTLDQPRRGGGNGAFVFRANMHDAGEKVVLGHALKSGRGIEDGEEVLDIVASHPSTARFIATKLTRRFVSDDPDSALVARATATFIRTRGDIRETARTIVTSPEFFSRAAYKSKVKSPFELVVSALRAIGAQPDSTPRTALIVAQLGQPLFLHQAPNGYPETGEAWINTGAILNRINFGLAVAGGRVPGASLESWDESAKLASAPREQQVDGVVRTLLGGEASPDTRRVLLSGVNPLLANAPADSLVVLGDSSATMSAHSALPEELRARKRRGNPLGAPVKLEGLAQLVGLALGSPEFQRR
ncbi:MAG: DUF1800 domain-containing protein [Gemmatimonadaceae bacterium]